MKKLLLTLLAVSSLTSCTIDEDHWIMTHTPFKKIVINPLEAVITTQILVAFDDNHVEQEPVLMEYLADFVEDAAEQGIDISYVYDHQIKLMFGNWDDSNLGGLSTGYKNNESIVIYIHKRYWKRRNDKHRRFLIYHELGHDIFNMKHGDNKLMNPILSIKDEASIVYADFWADAKR